MILLRFALLFGPPEPPPKTKFQVTLTLQDEQTIEVQPICYYDLLVSYHCTCCQHSVQYFPYWHRWLIHQLEESFWKIDNKIMSMRDDEDFETEARRLAGWAGYPKDESLVQNIAAYLRKIIQYYQKLNQQQVNLAAHYWNPFDFKNKIHYARGFTSQDNTNYPNILDADQLIKKVWKQYGIYEFNFKTRWYKTDQNYNKALDLDNGYLRWNNFFAKPDPERTERLLQDEDFWTNFEDNKKITQAGYLINNIDSGQYQYFNQQSIPIQLRTLNEPTMQYMINNPLTPTQVNYLFGGKGNSYYQKVNSINKLSSYTDKLKYQRNLLIPYYQYAMALHTRPENFIKKFCTTANDSRLNSMENPHNFMHNYQCSMMNDAQFSITNPIFFAYHSFIDLMLEIKIQWINHGFRPWEEGRMRGQEEEEGLSDAQKAVLGVRAFMSQQFPESKSSFKNAWRKYRHGSQGKTIINQQYPIFKWIISTFNENVDYLDAFDTVQGLNYTDMIIDDQNHQLKNLQTLFQVQYDIQDYTSQHSPSQLIRNIIEVTKVSANPQQPPRPRHEGLEAQQHRQSICVELNYQSRIRSKNLLVEVRDIYGDVVDYVPVGIFSRGNNARMCPNCPKYQSQNLLIHVPPNNFQGLRTGPRNLLQNLHSVDTSISINNLLTIQPTIKAEQNFFAKSAHVNGLRIKTGRQIVSLVGNSEGIQDQGSTKIRKSRKSVSSSTDNRIQLVQIIFRGQKRTIQGIHLAQRLNYSSGIVQFDPNSPQGLKYPSLYHSFQQTFQIPHTTITSIQATVKFTTREPFSFSYTFPLYAEYTELHFQFGRILRMEEDVRNVSTADFVEERGAGDCPVGVRRNVLVDDEDEEH